MKINKALMMIMFISWRLFGQGGSAKSSEMVGNFGEAAGLKQWRIVNDGVMGGLSRSQVNFQPEGWVHFNGTISLKNNGGFASLRRSFDHPISSEKWNGIRLKVRGDGLTYQISLRETSYFNGYSFVAGFSTEKDVWRIVELPFVNFDEQYFGRNTGEKFIKKPRMVKEMALLAADKQAGPFRLDIAWIELY